MAIGMTNPAPTITPVTTAVAVCSDRTPAFHSAFACAGGTGRRPASWTSIEMVEMAVRSRR